MHHIMLIDILALFPFNVNLGTGAFPRLIVLSIDTTISKSGGWGICICTHPLTYLFILRFDLSLRYASLLCGSLGYSLTLYTYLILTGRFMINIHFIDFFSYIHSVPVIKQTRLLVICIYM